MSKRWENWLHFQSSSHQDDFLFNYTEKQLLEEAKNILCLGPKFVVPLKPSETPIPRVIKDMEFCISNTDMEGENEEICGENRNRLRANIVKIVSRYYNQNDNMAYIKVRKNLRITRSYLRENEDLIVAG